MEPHTKYVMHIYTSKESCVASYIWMAYKRWKEFRDTNVCEETNRLTV